MRYVYKLRGFMASLPIIGSFLCFYQRDSLHFFLGWGIGLLLFLAGLSLRIWSIQHIRYRIKNRAKTAKDLTTTGPYGIVRNPLYIANTLICSGTVLFSSILWLAAFTFVYCLVLYNLVILYEEDHLEKKYGEKYRRYLQEVPRWIPGILMKKRLLQFRTDELFTTLKVELPTILLIFPFVLQNMATIYYFHF